MSAPTANVPTTSAADSNVAASSAPAETTSAAQPTSAQSTPAETQTSTPEATTAAPTSAAPETTSAPAEPTSTSTPETSSPATTSPASTTPVTDPTTSLSSSISTTPISVSSSATDVTSSPGQTTTASISTSTFVTTITSTDNSDSSATSTESSSTASSTAADSGSGGSGGGGGLSDGARIAIAVVVPVVAIAGLAAGGLWWWKRRKAQQVAEEERRKEAEDYSYNPNGDPTIPGAVASADGSYEMRQESNTGYRGWGNTTIGSTGRKASTTLSGPVAVAYSDDTSPSHGAPDARSGDRLLESQADSYSPEGEILGAMGTGAQGQGGDVHRGLSNASSSYSAAGRSDGSGDGNIGVAYSGVVNNQFYDQYGTANPYDVQYQEGYGPNGHGGVAGGVSSLQPGELPGQPVIRDNPARRNTRIESPSHFPQQSAGIAQNF